MPLKYQKIYLYKFLPMNTLTQNKEYKTQERLIIFAGSFDPWTLGHLSVIVDYFDIFPEGKIRILVAKNSLKKYTFSDEERKFLIEKTLPESIKKKVEVEIYHGVIADYVYEHNCAGILKWIRNGEDFEYEATMAHANSYFSWKIKTIMLPQVEGDMTRISSSVTKLIDGYGWKTAGLISPLVQESLRLKRKGQWLVGITWWTGCGKTTLSKKLLEYSKEREIPIFHIDIDTIIYELYQKPTTPIRRTIRQKMLEAFWEEIVNTDETINRKILWNIVFSDSPKKKLLEKIVGEAFLHELRKKIESINEKGIILLDWALFVEYWKTELCDKNLIIVSIPKEKQIKRISVRDTLSQKEIEQRMNHQLSESQRKDIIREAQEGEFDRLFLEIDGNEYEEAGIYEKLLKEYRKREKIVR